MPPLSPIACAAGLLALPAAGAAEPLAAAFAEARALAPAAAVDADCRRLRGYFGFERLERAEPALDRMAGHILRANGLAVAGYCGVLASADAASSDLAIDLPSERGRRVRFVSVSLGTLRSCRTDSQLAGVLAHELAHLHLGHAAASEELHARLAARLSGAALEAELSRRARADEAEADRLAVYLAARAGYDPWGLAAGFDLQLEQDPSNPKRFDDPLHPPMALRRIDAAAEARRVETVPAGRPVNVLAELRALGY